MKRKAFTIIEFVVVFSIIAILSAIVLISYRSGQQQLALQRAASKLAQDIRRAQEMAMSARELPGVGVPAGGYGVCFDKSLPTSFQIYADTTPPWGRCGPRDQTVETISFESGVKMATGALPDKISVNFKPPDPTIEIKDNNNDSYDELVITLQLIADPTKTKAIKVNRVGRIEIQ